MSSIDLSISIVNFNTKVLLCKCLRSVFNATQGISFEVFVVDNASKDGSAEMVRNKYPQVRLIENAKNLGFASANNLALAQARGRYFVLLNSDTEVQDNALAKLTRFMDETPDCGICCPQLIYPDGRLQKSYSAFSYPPHWKSAFLGGSECVRDLRNLFLFLIRSSDSVEKRKSDGALLFPELPTEVERPRGACFMVRSKAVPKVGLMDERFFMYCEEVDWALRFKRAGWKNYFVPEAKVTHVWGGSTEKINNLMDMVHQQSNYLYYWKDYGFKGWLLGRLYNFNGVWMSLLLGLAAIIVAPFGFKGFKAEKQFLKAGNLFRRAFLFKNIKPKDAY